MTAAKLLLPILLMSQGMQSVQAAQPGASQIPSRFHGVWDGVAGSCTSQSDALLRVTATEMVFYESVSKVLSVRQDKEGAVITVSSTGEGETWETIYRLRVENGRLFMEVAGTNYGAFERKRCS